MKQKRLFLSFLVLGGIGLVTAPISCFTSCAAMAETIGLNTWVDGNPPGLISEKKSKIGANKDYVFTFNLNKFEHIESFVEKRFAVQLEKGEPSGIKTISATKNGKNICENKLSVVSNGLVKLTEALTSNDKLELKLSFHEEMDNVKFFFYGVDDPQPEEYDVEITGYDKDFIELDNKTCQRGVKYCGTLTSLDSTKPIVSVESVTVNGLQIRRWDFDSELKLLSVDGEAVLGKIQIYAKISAVPPAPVYTVKPVKECADLLNIEVQRIKANTKYESEITSKIAAEPTVEIVYIYINDQPIFGWEYDKFYQMLTIPAEKIVGNVYILATTNSTPLTKYTRVTLTGEYADKIKLNHRRILRNAESTLELQSLDENKKNIAIQYIQIASTNNNTNDWSFDSDSNPNKLVFGLEASSYTELLVCPIITESKEYVHINLSGDFKNKVNIDVKTTKINEQAQAEIKLKDEKAGGNIYIEKVEIGSEEISDYSFDINSYKIIIPKNNVTNDIYITPKIYSQYEITGGSEILETNCFLTIDDQGKQSSQGWFVNAVADPNHWDLYLDEQQVDCKFTIDNRTDVADILGEALTIENHIVSIKKVDLTEEQIVKLKNLIKESGDKKTIFGQFDLVTEYHGRKFYKKDLKIKLQLSIEGAISLKTKPWDRYNIVGKTGIYTDYEHPITVEYKKTEDAYPIELDMTKEDIRNLTSFSYYMPDGQASNYVFLGWYDFRHKPAQISSTLFLNIYCDFYLDGTLVTATIHFYNLSVATQFSLMITN